MSKAAELLKKYGKAKATKGSETVRVDDCKVEVPSFSREVRLKALARHYRSAVKRMKSVQAEIEELKGVLRALGENELRSQFANGEYVSAVDMFGVKVTRANKYGKLAYPPEVLKEAVGDAYGSMFQEDAVLKFRDHEELQAHLDACNNNGITVGAKIEKTVKGRSGLTQRMAEIWNDLDDERRELLLECAGTDQRPRVVG